MTTWRLAVLVGAATAMAVMGATVALGGDGSGERDSAAPAAVAAQHSGA